jgi:hypothetical protein
MQAKVGSEDILQEGQRIPCEDNVQELLKRCGEHFTALKVGLSLFFVFFFLLLLNA